MHGQTGYLKQKKQKLSNYTQRVSVMSISAQDVFTPLYFYIAFPDI